jgi:isobutyryl-CoA mutase
MVAASKYQPVNPVRVVTAASLFDGHDAAINVMRRILQSTGCEVIHLGHNRSVEEVVQAAIEEDAQSIGLSSYQGGHMEFFKYMKDLLVERGAGHVRIFGGGGGVIVPREIKELQEYGITRIYSPEDGRHLGLQGMINDMVEGSDYDPLALEAAGEGVLEPGEGGFGVDIDPQHHMRLARLITLAERRADLPPALAAAVQGWKQAREAALAVAPPVPVLGVTGTGGAGKSSLVDELIIRFLRDFPERNVAVICVDPSKRLTGGALLGDRIRMNSISSPRVFMRSLATRGAQTEVAEATGDALEICRLAGFDLVILETAGIGQGDSDVVDLSDLCAYVMTPEYGAASQLEKIDMIDFASFLVLNKYESKGAEDALRDVRKQYRRSHELWDPSIDDMQLPVFGTIASRFNDPGITALYRGIVDALEERAPGGWVSSLPDPGVKATSHRDPMVPAKRIRYLADIAETVRAYKANAEAQARLARRREGLLLALEELDGEGKATIVAALANLEAQLDAASLALLQGWPAIAEAYAADEFVYSVRGRDIHVPATTESLAGLKLRKVATPHFISDADTLRWLLLENVPGRFPFTAGLFPFRRPAEAPKRMFAGEGPPIRTNRRFHLLCEGEKAHRLSTAFDSVTLYGDDPDERPDIWGKVGESGVSVCTLDDVKILYGGFDLCSPTTSVSMTINGPAPIMLAMYLNAAIDQQVGKFNEEHGRQPTAGEHTEITDTTLKVVRGTVQADILKEDQAQNTCIFNIEFALKMMGDIQEWFIHKGVRNYYSVSISGYHIAEAGANAISQTAFTLANGFTLVEYYLARGMDIDAFAANLSFFFSNGLEPEYTVIGRVARRIWSVAMRDRYGANERSQKLKYHVQTSGRSLHAQEIQFNDIRTTLQALMGWNDNCNSLHTNAYDEAITTPTEESVRRAMAIQLIIQKELGIARSENSLQGSFVMEELTDLVEEAVLTEFERLADRGGVLGAMERQYQRSKIQDESLLYEHRKHDGSYPIVGVNTFLNPKGGMASEDDSMELIRATPEEKNGQIESLRAFQGRHADETEAALKRLEQVALSGGNIFAELMQTVRVASLGQITTALYQVGGQYRRSM